MSEDRKPRKTILPKRQTFITDVVLIPSVDNLLDDAMTIIANEFVFYRTKTNKGEQLKAHEAKIVHSLLDSLLKLSKENRERDKLHDLDKLTDEELLDLAEQLLEKRNDKVVKASN